MRILIRFLIVVLLPFTAFHVQAQVIPQTLVSRGSDMPLTFPQTSKLQEASLLEQRNIELLSVGTVDPATYILGPGDVLSLEVLGAFSLSAQDIVSADGTITFDQLGTIQVGGLTLDAARVKLRGAGRKVISSSEVKLVLRSTRAFKIHVAGKVVEPGAIRASAQMRVSEAIASAGGFTKEGSLRGITIRRRDGTETSADLLPFLSQGDVKGNPTVLDGDIIVVHTRGVTVSFEGAVQYPGRYDLLPQDSLRELLSWVGLNAHADSSQAWLERHRGGGLWEPKDLDLQGVLSGALDIALSPNDRVLIHFTESYHTRAVVQVLGAVRQPGPVPLERGKSRALDLVALAGGPLDGALVERTVLARALGVDSVKVKDPTSRRSFMEDLTRMDALESIIDLSMSAGPLVEPGDIIWIPWDQGFVQVLGQVKRPGVYDHVDGWSSKDYIEAAGGYGKQADKKQTRVSKGQHGQAVFADDLDTLAPGDLLWVPEKPPGSLWETIRNATTVITSVATLYLLVREASR